MINQNFFKGKIGATLCFACRIGVLALLILMPRWAFAQNASPAVGHKGLQILLLGTHGGPTLVERQSESATLLIVDGRSYLIDCGIGTVRRLLEAGAPSQQIETIFITHGHPDHALGLADVLADDYQYLAVTAPASRQEFDVYGPPETPALVSAAYEYIKIPCGIFAAEPIGRNEFVDPFRAHVIDHDGLVYQDDTIRLTAAENSHYQLLPAKYHASMKSSIRDQCSQARIWCEIVWSLMPKVAGMVPEQARED